MRYHRPRRLAAACRLLLIPFISAIAPAHATAAAAAQLAGTIVDQNGRPLPRVLIRVLDAGGAQVGSVFSDESGRFSVTAAEPCRIEAALTGFRTASAACGAAQPLRITLAVAPIEETVIITATRTEAPSSAVGASVTAFTADDLERERPLLVSDLLRTMPGATVIASGGLGGVTSLFVRGGESNYNKVLLDGVPINEPGGTFNFNNLTPDGFERIEVVRGANSALFGSDAMASVIQLFTRRGDRPTGPTNAADLAQPHGWGLLEGGTFGSLRAQGGVSGRLKQNDRIDYAASIARIRTDNDAPNNTFENTTLTGNAGVALSKTASLRIVARTEMGRAGTPGQTAFGRPDLDAFFDRHDTVAGVTFDQQLTARLRQRATYSLAASNQQSTNLVADPPYTPRFEGHVAPWISVRGWWLRRRSLSHASSSVIV